MNLTQGDTSRSALPPGLPLEEASLDERLGLGEMREDWKEANRVVGDLPDAELEARFGLLEAIATSQLQIVPDFAFNMDNNDTALSSDEHESDQLESLSCHTCRKRDKSADALPTQKEATHINVFEEACKISKKAFLKVSSRQDHILLKHSDKSGSILELLKMHQQLPATRSYF